VIARVAALVALTTAAHANPTAKPPAQTIAALSSGPDVRDAVAIGPAGEAYEPDHHGAWIRHHAGGIAATVVHAARVGATVIVGVQAGPPFELHAGMWSAIYVGQHAKALLGRGPRATAAVGKLVFALAGGARTSKLPEAPGVITAVGASPRGITVETDVGLARLDGAKWKPIANVPARVVALLDDRWALVDRGVLDLRAKPAAAIAWPPGFHPASVVALDDIVIAAGAHNTTLAVVTLHTGKPPIIDPFTFDHAAPIVAVAADKSGRVIVAAHDGQLAIRDHGQWTTAHVSDDLPPPREGSPPGVQAGPAASSVPPSGPAAQP
jgi:hypothetical protein